MQAAATEARRRSVMGDLSSDASDDSPLKRNAPAMNGTSATAAARALSRYIAYLTTSRTVRGTAGCRWMSATGPGSSGRRDS